MLITGASSGIGEALARRYARAGFNLVLVARRADRLEALAATLIEAHGVKAWAVAADLSQVDAARKLAQSMRRARRSIDVLINNAGILEQGAFVAIPAARHRELVDLNVAGMTAMLAEFVPAMVSRGHGRILNVASIAAFQPVPSLATYAATKAYVLSLTESLAEELQGTGVSVTALCPGLTATDMLTSATRNNQALTRLPRMVVSTADSVADEAFEACERGERIRVPGVLNQAAILASRTTPRWLLRRVTAAMSRRMR